MLRSAGGHWLKHVSLGLFLLLATSVFLTGTVQAAFPEREIRFIVPWAPGGGTDVMARTLQAILEDRGVKIVVDNRPGGSSAVGMAELIQARPDGYTVGVASSTILSLMALKQVPFQLDQFTNILLLSEDPLMLLVSTNSQWNTIDDFMDHMRSNPGTVTIGTPGANNVNHAMAALAALAVDVPFRHVAFDGGARVVAALMGGHIDAAVLKPSETIGQIQAGDLRPLAVYRDQRLAVLPEVPTFAERGYDVFPFGTVAQISHIVAPAGLDPEVRERLVDLFREAALSPEFQAFAEKSGFLSEGVAGADLDAYVEEIFQALSELGSRVFSQ